jgi:hypothetical protein
LIGYLDRFHRWTRQGWRFLWMYSLESPKPVRCSSRLINRLFTSNHKTLRRWCTHTFAFQLPLMLDYHKALRRW